MVSDLVSGKSIVQKEEETITAIVGNGGEYIPPFNRFILNSKKKKLIQSV